MKKVKNIRETIRKVWGHWMQLKFSERVKVVLSMSWDPRSKIDCPTCYTFNNSLTYYFKLTCPFFSHYYLCLKIDIKLCVNELLDHGKLDSQFWTTDLSHCQYNHLHHNIKSNRYTYDKWK